MRGHYIPPNVQIIEGNHIEIKAFKHPRDVSAFLDCVNDVFIKKGYQDCNLSIHTGSAFFPNAAVPICAYMDLIRNNGYEIAVSKPANPLLSSFVHPIEASPANLNQKAESLSKIWKFDKSQVFDLVTALIAGISEHIECKEGVLDSIEWCLNEVMDNVLQHSRVDYGYIMAQVHRDSHHVTICVADCGIGIFNTLRMSKYKPRTPVDALTLSIKPGVTRSEEIGRGNGLFGLSEINMPHCFYFGSSCVEDTLTRSLTLRN